jgi:hypothetical protein
MGWEMTDFEAQVLADLCVLKTQMKEIVGNGQPGRLCHLETRMLEHEKTVQRFKGMAAAFGGLLTVAHLAIDVLVGRR